MLQFYYQSVAVSDIPVRKAMNLSELDVCQDKMVTSQAKESKEHPANQRGRGVNAEGLRLWYGSTCFFSALPLFLCVPLPA